MVTAVLYQSASNRFDDDVVSLVPLGIIKTARERERKSKCACLCEDGIGWTGISLDQEDD